MKLLKFIGRFTLTTLAVCYAFSVVAQAPFVETVSKNSGRAQETISLQGINFGTNPANIKVAFGAVNVTPQLISDQLIEVSVPPATVYQNISVINTVSGLSGFSQKSFQLSHGGSNPFDPVKMGTQTDFASESGLYDLTLADFDGDGKSDIATANQTFASINVFLNTSTPGVVSFTKNTLAVGVNTLHVSSADLNGDGRQEIMVSENNGTRIFIYKNNSTLGSLVFAVQSITIPGSQLSQVRVIDMDLDGKPEMVITDHTANRVMIMKNQSTLATISFAAATIIPFASGTAGVDGIAVGDLDGNSLPEIVACEFLSASGKIFILKNQSVPGSLSFVSQPEIMASTSVSNLQIGDLDGDGKADLAATALLANSVFLYRNQSTATTIQFAAPTLVAANDKPWGLDFGDMDGDGKTDIAVASITQKVVTILNNQSTTGNFAFTRLTKTTTFINRHIRIGDIDGDARPDLNFTSIDDLNLGVFASKISVFTNLNCMTPVISPPGPLNICSGFSQDLDASNSPGATYEWFKDAVSQGAPGPSPTLNVTASGTYTVRLVSGACSILSSGVAVTVTPGASGAVTPAPVPPVCVGGTLNLSVNDVSATDYVWTGPAFAVPAHGLSVSSPNFQSPQAGKYTVEVMMGSCVAQRESIVVDVVDIPGVQVTYPGADVICAGQNKLLSYSPTVSGYTYQWADQTTGDIGGATGATYLATTSGSYLLKLTSVASPSCPAVQTAPKSLRVAAIPVVDFAMPATACAGQPVNFTDQSILDSDTTGLFVNFAWEFGDAGTARGATVSHTYAAANSYSVKHTVSYKGQSCATFKTKLLSVVSGPSAVITNPSNKFIFCPGDNLQLQTGTFDSYLWSNGETTQAILVTTAGDYFVDVTLGGCTTRATKTVTQFAAPTVVASANPGAINAGETSKLSVNGLTTAFMWSPGKFLSDSLVANPDATPEVTTTYTASGKDVNGCKGEATVVVTVIVDNPLNTMKPNEFFSPNGDGINDVWLVQNAPALDQCGCDIYDERGLRVFQAKPYLNDWGGISSGGKTLPAGVYFYVIKCDDSPKKHLAGSINIVR